MKLKDFRIGWRTLIQEPAYSLVVVLGLGIGLAACMLLLGFVRYSWQYDAQVPDVDNVVVVKTRYNLAPGEPWFDRAHFLLLDTAMKTPGVLHATGFAVNEPDPVVRVDGHLKKLQGLTVFPGLVEMLGLHTIEGDLKAALEQPENFAITEEAAIKAFGTSRALGRIVHANGKVLRVAAILRNPPTNTTMPFETLNGINSLLVSDNRRADLLTHRGFGKILIRLRPGCSLTAITQALQHASDQSPEDLAKAQANRDHLGNSAIATT